MNDCRASLHDLMNSPLFRGVIGLLLFVVVAGGISFLLSEPVPGRPICRKPERFGASRPDDGGRP